MQGLGRRRRAKAEKVGEKKKDFKKGGKKGNKSGHGNSYSAMQVLL